MKKNLILKSIAIILSVLMITMSTGLSFAASKEDQLNKDKDKIEDQIDKTKENLTQLKEEKKDTLDEIGEISEKIENYQDEINGLNSQIKDLTTSISEAQTKIEEANIKYDKHQKLLDERLVTIYENGETTYLDVLLSSQGLTDFISKYFMVSELATADTELLESIEKQKQEIENAKRQLEEDKGKIESAKTNKQLKSKELESAKKEKDQKVAKLSSEEKMLQKQLEQFQKDKKDLEDELTRLFEESQKNNQNNGSNGSNTQIPSKPSQSGYINPVPGYRITCGFYGYSGHTGVDFAGSGIYGKPVVAVKDGTVVKAKITTGDIPNYNMDGSIQGYYRSYGVYIVIDHHDGTMTLYAHGKPGSLNVKVGQNVKRGQQIMKVGNTGNVRPRPTPSNPTGGAHLHFEVQILKNGKATAVNPAPYLP